MMRERCFGPIRFIPGLNNGKYPFCHSLYIDGAGVLIDPASDRERLVRLREEPGVKAVWLSHWHEDHLMHLDLFDDIPLWISQEDAPPLSDLERFLDWYGMQEAQERDAWKAILTQQFHFRGRTPESLLRDGERIQLATVTVQVIRTPGHTPGHLSLFFEEPQVLFLGDYDLTKFGPWYGDVYSSIEEVRASVARLRKIPARVWLTSHESGVFEEDPSGLWDQYLHVIQEREEKLLEFLKKARSMQEIVEAWIVYGRPREPASFFVMGERAIMGKHLDDLLKRSRVVCKGDKYCRVDGASP
jgi:glyoxylase-like metal-dependent hydrolase (beta-lactamase superfamily II)